MLLNNAGNAAPAGAAQDLSIARWDGNNVSCPLNDFLSNNHAYNGFMDRIYSSDLSTFQLAMALDQYREWNDYSNANVGSVSQLRPYPGIATGIGTASQFTNQHQHWSVLPNEVYGGLHSKYCPKANVSHLLGFPNMPEISVWTLDADGDRFAESFSVPDILPSRSIFVRLENFGNESVNAFQGLKSKIIAHLPRFDGVNSLGPLYLEPHNLVYVDLKNPAPIKINSFDISLCYSDETYATSLVGTTIIVLHVKEKGT